MIISVADYARTIETVMARLAHARNVSVDTFITDPEAALILPTLMNNADDRAFFILLKAKLEQAIGLGARATVTGQEAGFIIDIFQHQKETIQ